MMMAEYQHEAKNLPPGWDCKYDVNTGKCYYFNYLTKAMSLEDPRIRMRQLQLQQSQDPSITNMAEHIPLQPMHGSPYHVYPTNNHQAVQAFQGPHPNQHNHHVHQQQPSSYPYGASPMLASKYHQQLEMSPILRHQQHSASPHMPRIMSQLARQQQQQHPSGSNNLSSVPMAASLSQQQQETSFITAADTEAAVVRINTMFPTANDDHIRLLMKKYHNREAVVISALQVEKHPIATPGPFATPPPPGRHATLLAAAANAFGINASTTTVHSMTPLLGRGHGSRSSSRFAGIVSEALLASSSSRTGSPVPGRPTSSCASVMTMATTVMPLSHHQHHQYHASASHGIAAGGGSPRVAVTDSGAYRSSPKPHSSPKMKLRYLKSIFPKADETLLLDTLANADNNVQHASEHLLTLGYEKRDTTAPKVTNRNREEQVMRDRQLAENTPPSQPKVRTNEEKQRIKSQLQTQYADIPGRIITMALESVDYSEDRACQILMIVMQDDKKPPPTASATAAEASDETDNGLTTATATGVRTDVDGFDSVQSPSSSDSLDSEATTTTSTTGDSEQSNDVQLLRKSKRVRAMTHSKSHTQIGARPIATMVKSSTTIMPATPAAPDASSLKADFQSTVERIRSDGPNAEQCKGPNEDLLLADYISWNGANPEMRVGHKSLARGPNAELRSASSSRHSGSKASGSAAVTGANAELCKGAQTGLAKGSMYAQLGRQLANVKCN